VDELSRVMRGSGSSGYLSAWLTLAHTMTDKRRHKHGRQKRPSVTFAGIRKPRTITELTTRHEKHSTSLIVGHCEEAA
jgi:hypothetical protein